MRWSAAEALTWITRGEAMTTAVMTAHPDGRAIYRAARSACESLRQALRDERVVAWALPAGSRTDDPRPFEQVEARWFRDGQATIHPDGRIAAQRNGIEYQGREFAHAEFDAARIKAAFVSSQPALTAWMQAQVDEFRARSIGQVPKAADLIRDCMAQHNCTRDKARAAYAALPADAKSGLGRPRGK
jgi:hypothetical protein